MSAHIADYVLMQDRDSFSLPGPRPTAEFDEWGEVNTQITEKTLTFRLPSNTVLDEPSIIAFVANPSAKERIEYEIEINGHVFAMGDFGSGVVRGLWKVVGGGVLRADDSNSITFRTLEGQVPEHGGQPTIKFSDIVLWFQRAVAEAS